MAFPSRLFGEDRRGKMVYCSNEHGANQTDQQNDDDTDCVPKFGLLHPIGIIEVIRMPMFHNMPHVSRRCIMQRALRRSVRSMVIYKTA